MAMFKGKVVNTGDKKFPLAPAGNHPAVLVGIYDIGSHEDDYDKTKSPRMVRQVAMIWELTGEKDDTGANHVVSKLYTISFHKKSGLKQMLERWKGVTFNEGDDMDLYERLGKACLVSVVHVKGKEDKTFAKVDGISAILKGMTISPPTHTPFVYEIPVGEGEGLATFDIKTKKLGAFDKAAGAPEDEWIPYVYGAHPFDYVKDSPEWKELKGGGTTPSSNGKPAVDTVAAGDDEVPY